jgi:hypothetical protein
MKSNKYPNWEIEESTFRPYGADRVWYMTNSVDRKYKIRVWEMQYPDRRVYKAESITLRGAHYDYESNSPIEGSVSDVVNNLESEIKWQYTNDE